MRLTSLLLSGALALGLAGCGNPLADTPRLSDVTDADTAAQADLRGDPGNASQPISETTPPPQSETTQAPRQRGLLGFFSRQADAAKSEGAASEDGVDTAALKPEAASDDTAAPATGGGGLFGGLLGGGSGSGGPRPGAPDYRQVGPGVTLPYGQIARLCGAPVQSFGTESLRYPERGSGYKLYDTAPGSTALRSFFLTGFDDGCARQFTAALVIFGEPEIYEQIRYGPAGASQPVSETDNAYETLKSRVCGVRKGQPCGSRIGRMSRNTVFVSIYERFGSNPRWKNILVHDGEVLALDIKNR